MEIYCNGIARIKHNKTGKIYEIDEDELTWDVADISDRQMGPETHYEAVVEHPQLGKLTWGLWEYPSGIENYFSANIGDHIFLQNFEYGLEHEKPEPEPEDWINE
ncbi:MAG: hypothetical protein KDE09_12190 [Anaerolineales bacterium]|nr:hypothetical protein [Anaerolineales bacterium]